MVYCPSPVDIVVVEHKYETTSAGNERGARDPLTMSMLPYFTKFNAFPRHKPCSGTGSGIHMSKGHQHHE